MGTKSFDLGHDYLITLKNRRRHGLTVDWFKDGKLWAKVNYKNGYLDGYVAEWNSDGSYLYKDLYKNGELKKMIYSAF